MSRTVLTFTLFLLTKAIFAQNLVPNPSFETFNNCPAGNSGISNGLVPSWSNCPGSITTPDYFHTCALPGTACMNVNVPNNFAGNATALTGNAYAGVITYYTACPNCREYIMAQLTTPLVAGQTYNIGMNIRLGSRSEYATNAMGMNLSNAPLNQPGNQPIVIVPTLEQTAVITNPNNWVLVSGTYVATGGEQYVTIGNFRNNGNTTVNTVSFGGSSCLLATAGCNFFIDDVFVIPQNTQINVTGDTIICAGDMDTLVATGSTSGYSWETLANPGVVIGTNDTLIVSPAVTTTYLVYSATDSAVITVQVNPLPVIDLGNDTTLCGGSLLLNASTPNATYLWQNGSTQPTLTASASGIYWAEVTVNGCRVRDSIQITIIAPSSLHLGNDTTICNGGSIILNATSPGSTYLWSNGSTQPTITVTTSGLYWAQITAGGCSTRDSINVTIVPALNVNIGNDTIICNGGSLAVNATTPNATYLWSTGSTQSSINITTTGTYWVEVTVSGCTTADTISAGMVPPVLVDLGNDTTLCSGNSLLLDATTPLATGYLWSNGNTTPQLSVNTSGNYGVTVSVGPCTGSDNITVNFITAPPGNFLPDTSACAGQVVTLQAPAGYNPYQWSNGAAASSVNVTTSGNYWVIVGAGSCTSGDTATVTFIAGPSVNIGPDRQVCEDSSVTLRPLNIDPSATYTWNNGSAGTQITVDQAGTYSVTAVNSCGTDVDSVDISRIICTCFLYLPNTFTPNDDGINEMFGPGYECDIRDYELLIFDRWGELIFRSKNPNIGWKGTVNADTMAPNGIYVYYLRYENIFLEEGFREMRGYVNLVR